MKDLFSGQAKSYAIFRPNYPESLYQWLFQQVKHFDCALDAATGNGQVAAKLAEKFSIVYANDISSAQLEMAPADKHIIYTNEAAETANYKDDMFDLITVAQAIHWFNFDGFYALVKRVLKRDGLLAVIGYGLAGFTNNSALQEWLRYFYKDITGPFWDAERKYIDDLYTTIPFPFDEINTPALRMQYTWSRDQFAGYISTWSAVQHFKKQKGYEPLSGEVLQQLNRLWPNDALMEIQFPLLLRAGHLK